jgi:hypothetical protein
MRLHVRYLDDGKEVDIVTVSASARHLWEKDHGPLIDSMTSGRSDWCDFLAHTTLQRSGRTDLDLLGWLDTVDTVLWEMSADHLVATAEALGVVPKGAYVAVGSEDPTGPQDGAPSPADS